MDVPNYIKKLLDEGNYGRMDVVEEYPISDRYCQNGKICTVDLGNMMIMCGGAWFDLDDRWKFLTLIEHQKREYADAWECWRKGFGVMTVESAHGFKVGDRVTFTNEAGCKFKGLTVLGILAGSSDEERCVYTNSDAYWFPKEPKSLTKE